ncbi:TPA: terminase large subunit [Enterococcus faecium]|uniref:terminase large subunit n=1 Tax=Enterococcus faecium TaxID=1352 RepID=UPI00248BBFC6|nr:terminase large subunit [Enterococcus faecium]
MDLMSLSYSELERWWADYKEEQASWGGILLEPYPELLTTWYAERLIDGSIPASKENILAAKRHVLDLERQGTEEFPWIFDEEVGHRPIRFIEDNCRPTEGDFDRFILQPWQHFIIGSMFGWIHKDTGIRRFREALTFVGRKNGKTSLISGLSAYMLGYDHEQGANVYVLANAKDQASILFDKTKEMVKQSPRLDKKYKPQRSTIKDEATFSKMEARASDSKKLDGLNTHFAIFDEIHEFINFKLINVIKKSRGTRRQPLIVYITTAGYVLDGPLMQYYDNALDCLEHLEDGLDERVFYFVAKLDDVSEADDPRNWIKANPNIGLMSFVDLVTDWKTERNSPQERADWITKQFNLFSDIDELSFLDMQTINKNNKIIDWETMEGEECVGGYDLSETQDFTSADLEFPIYETGEIAVLEHSWISQERYNNDNNKQRLDAWIKSGDLTVTPGSYVDYQFVFDWFVEQSKKYKILKIRYDRRNSLILNRQMIDYGFVMEEAIQGFTTLGGPMKDLKERFLDGKVIYNQQKIFRWYLSNVKLVQDRNNNWMPTKQSKNRKIDGFAAVLNSHVSVVEMFATKSKQSGTIGFISVREMMRGGK